MSDLLPYTTRLGIAFFFFIALGFALVVQGAVPFVLTPTLGQAVWTTGFSRSFLNDALFAIYAHNIGAPKPAAIAFGLSGAWPVALFLKLGLSAPDAYAAMIATWLSVAFFSAYGIARHFSVSTRKAILAAFCWLTMPMIWAHASYSMLSTGIALLALYFLFALKMFDAQSPGSASWRPGRRLWFFLYPAVCLISVFMDGYSFVMFAVGASLLGAWQFIVNAGAVEKRLLFFSFPTHFLSLGLACFLYVQYIGGSGFRTASLDFFRGWGIDLTFLVLPTKGMHWIPDLLGLSVPRSADRFFGDASVWRTTFCLPLVLGAVWAGLQRRSKQPLVFGFLLVALFGFYMSLGPSLKVDAVKPKEATLGPKMPAEYALAPTGSAILSKKVPGFKSMRASYRWAALGVFGAWCLLVVGLSKNGGKKGTTGAMLILVAVILLHFPHLPTTVKQAKAHRNMFLRLEEELIDLLRQDLSPREKVAFVPWRNDFLVNYAAAVLDVVAYNIGGDKNFAEARRHWPKTMLGFSMHRVDPGFSDRVLLLLDNNDADVVVLPYIDLLWAAHRWPYPVQYREALAPVVEKLAASGRVEIRQRRFYAAVRLKSE